MAIDRLAYFSSNREAEDIQFGQYFLGTDVSESGLVEENEGRYSIAKYNEIGDHM